MITVIINNSESKIQGLSVLEHKALAKALSYSVETFNQGYQSRRVSLLSSKGIFPTGLLYIVETYLKSLNRPYSKLDNRRVPISKQNLFKIKL